MGICKCVYKHIPLGELNTTLEIVFSTQVYLTIPVDSVRCVSFSDLHKGKLLAKSTTEFSRRKRGGVRDRKDLPLGLSPELLDKAGKLPPDLRQMFTSSPTKKVLLFWSSCLLQTQKHLVNPSIAGLGGSVCVLHRLRPSLIVSSFPLPLLHARDTDTQSGWDMQ